MAAGEISVRVDCAEALSLATDVLVLKYAQASYGIDRLAAEALGIDTATLPQEGAHLVVPGGSAVAARHVVFVGLAPIGSFDYRSIRTFARQALALSAQDTPDVREICMTLHGVGFGLDEEEAFESEVGGIFDAISAGTYPPGLDTVRIIDINPQRADRLRTILERLVPNNQIEAAHPFGQDSVGEGSAERLRSVGYDSSARGHSFVAMPFEPAFDDVLYFGIAPPIRAAGLLCERMDHIAFTGDIVVQMKDRIGRAAFMVADLTTANPNVYLEVGYAWGRGIPTILVCRQGDEPTFDVRGHRYLSYSSIRQLNDKLTGEITGLMGNSRPAQR
jgi:hypothetical protein